MARIKPQAALTLAYWLSLNHPAIFAALAKRAAVGQKARQLSGLGCGCGSCGMSGLGQDDTALFNPDPSVFTTDLAPVSDAGGISESTFTFDTVDPATGGTSPYTFNVDPTTTFITPSIETPAAPSDLVAPIPSTGTAPATPASPSVLSAVGNALLSPAVISSVVGMGTAYFRANAAASQAQTAQAVLATQVARVQAGGNPAAISYAVDPRTGQLTPVVSAPNGGTYPASPSLLAQLGGSSAAGAQISSFVSQYGLYIGIFAAVLILARR